MAVSKIDNPGTGGANPELAAIGCWGGCWYGGCWGGCWPGLEAEGPVVVSLLGEMNRVQATQDPESLRRVSQQMMDAAYSVLKVPSK